MHTRENLLRAGFQAMNNFRSDIVTWEVIGDTNPPDKYRITYNLKSIIGFNSDCQPQCHTGFSVEIKFPADYPSSPIHIKLCGSKPWPYHPNIWMNGRFDSGFDFGPKGESIWNPREAVPLDAICQLVGEIIAYQKVNIYTPANANPILLDWINDNLSFRNVTSVINPVDPSPIRLPDLKIGSPKSESETRSTTSETDSIFISYSHRDSDYAHRLAEALQKRGCNFWIDDRIDYGTIWPRVIQENLDKCSVFIVIMSPHSFESVWVQNELSRAQRIEKKIFTLLLEGNGPWLSVESVQYVDVRNGLLPPQNFFERILNVLHG